MPLTKTVAEAVEISLEGLVLGVVCGYGTLVARRVWWHKRDELGMPMVKVAMG